MRPGFAKQLKTAGYVGLMLSAAVLFASGVAYGLPQQFDSDETIFVTAAVDMVETGSLDPGWYGAPASLLMYLLAGMYWVFGLFQGGGHGIERALMNDVTAFLLPGRILVVLVTLASIPVMDRLMAVLKIQPVYRLPAIALFVLSPLVVEFASIIRMDMFQTVFNLAGLIFCVLALSKERFLWALAAAGVTVGLAVTSKYPGVVGAVPVAATVGLMLLRKEVSWGRASLGLVVSGAASLAAAFITGPYLFLNFSGVLRDLAEEARPFNLGHTSPGFIKGFFVYLIDVLPGAMSHVGVLLGLAGLTVLMPRDIRRAGGILLPIYFFSYLLFIAQLNLLWTRWTIPLVPVACIGVAISLARIVGWLSQIVWRPWIVAGVLAVMMLPLALVTLPAAAARAGNLDTRARATAWIEANIPHNSRVLVETYDPAVRIADYDLYYVISGKPDLVRMADISQRSRPDGFFGSLSHWSGSPDEVTPAIDRSQIDYVILSDWAQRYSRERPAWERENRIYDLVLARYHPVAEFKPGNGELGPPITILDARSCAAKRSC